MNSDEIIKMFIEKSRLKNSYTSNERECLTCNSRNPNWIIYLQNSLESANISLEKFCQMHISAAHSESELLFFIYQGRLCVNHKHEYSPRPECVTLGDIRKILDALLN